MGILELVKEALTATTRNKLRAILTMLGIIVGVGAVIAMIGIGEGSKRASIAIIRNMGSNMLTIFPGAPGTHTQHGPQAMGSAEHAQGGRRRPDPDRSCRIPASMPRHRRSRPRGQ